MATLRWKNLHTALKLTSSPKRERIPLFDAISSSDNAEVERILGGEGLESAAGWSDYRDERGRSALHWAAMSTSDRGITDVILGAGASVDATDGRGRTPLIYACESGYIDQVTALLQAGANPDACFDSGLSAMQIAARDGKFSIVKELVRFHAAVERRAGDERHRSALQWAVANGNQDITRVLIEQSADFNEPFPHFDVEHGRTPLMVAVRKGFKDTAEVLLSVGADVNCRDETGKRAFEYAVEAGLMGNPAAEEVKILLLSYSNSRVVAGGGEVRTMSQMLSVVLGLFLYYVNLGSDAVAAYVFHKKGDSYWFMLCVLSMLLPCLLHACYQFVKGFTHSAIRSLFALEPAYATYESFSTGLVTPTYMTLKNLELAFESVPQAILQGYSLLVHWNDWGWFDGDFEVYAILISIAISLLSSFKTATTMALENEDSTWKYSLKGFGGYVVTAVYFMGDGFFHIVSYIIFAYTYETYVFALGGGMLVLMFLLLASGFGFDVVGVEVLLRALILSPLMAAMDFPLKPHLHMNTNWIVWRSVTVSFVVLWTCDALALLMPIKKLPKSGDQNLDYRIGIMLGVATVVKFVAYFYIQSQERAKGKLAELELSTVNNNGTEDLPNFKSLKLLPPELGDAGGEPITPSKKKVYRNSLASVKDLVEERSPVKPQRQWSQSDEMSPNLLRHMSRVTMTTNPLHSVSEDAPPEHVSINLD